MVLACTPAARAFSLYSGTVAGNDLEVNLNTTVEYSNIFRVNSPSKVLTSDINANDGDLDFQHGLVDNTFDVLPVFDMKYGNYGVHVSGNFYLDTPYLGTSQNDSPSTYNPYSVAKNTDFTSATRNVNGENAQLLDAFAYGSQYFGANGQQSVTVKVGRQTLLWGQSLYFPTNGIAGGQAPIDVITADNIPNAQAQAVFLPVGQAVVTYAPNQDLNFQVYYQFQWEQDLLQGVGSYFSTTDILDKGGERIIGAPGAAYLYRAKDQSPPSSNGQFGAAVQGNLGQFDLGLYALRYDAKAPEGVYLGPSSIAGPASPSNVASYWLVYPRDIQLYGGSFSTTIWNANVAGEISGRRNMPLVSVASPFTQYPGSANAGALYPVGSTYAAQLSVIYVSAGLPLDPGGVTVTGELAMNHVLSVTANQAALEPGRDNTAAAFEAVVSPTYDNVLPSLDLQFPVGLKYNFLGKSQIDSTMNNGTGFVNVGVDATYRVTWTAALTYQDYFGKPDPVLNPLADRGYVTFSIQHTF
jgi:hypothetical protein